METPWLISEGRMLRTVILGAEMMRTVPVSSAAESRRLTLTLFETEPNVKPTAPPAPRPVAAGRLTAKFGVVVNRPPTGCDGESLPPATPTVLGKTRPVGFPV